MQDETTIDAMGLKCPLPVLKLRRVLLKLDPGAIVELRADDPMARIDVPHFCAEAGHLVLDEAVHGETEFRFRIKRSAKP